MMPPMTHAHRAIVESPAAAMTTPGFMKMPEPMTVPMTKDVATIKPMLFLNSACSILFTQKKQMFFLYVRDHYNMR